MKQTSCSGKIWKAREIDERKIYQYINDFELSDLLARILIARGIEADKVMSFLNPKIKDLLPDPLHLIDMKKACERAADSIEKNEKITVLGDYDVDGATSSALLIRFFNSIGANCAVYIPDRMTEGYGPSPEIMDKFKSNGSSLAITVDCGITAFAAMEHASKIGLDVIILDHHMSDITMPKAYAVVNPNRFDEKSEYKNLAAVGVSFLFLVGLMGILRKRGFFTEKTEPDLLNLLDLVALGTICDMMTLTGLNRAFVIQGLKIMTKRQNLGLKILSEYGKIDTLPSTYHLGFVIGPRINAGGRVGKSYLGSHLLATLDDELAHKYAQELENYNEERKVIEQQVLEEAMIMAEEQADKNYILVYAENWHPGVVGIVAGKLKERYQKPVAAMAIDGDVGKASCRSVRGIDLGSKIVEAKNKGILITGGGHAMAAGFTVDKNRIHELVEFLDEAMSKESETLVENNTYYYDAEVSPNAFNLNLAKEINKLEPYGNGNSEPLIKVAGLFVLKANVTNNRHISCLLAPDRKAFGSSAIKAIAFNCVGTPLADALLSEKALNLTVFGNIKINHWQGNSNAQLFINDIAVND